MPQNKEEGKFKHPRGTGNQAGSRHSHARLNQRFQFISKDCSPLVWHWFTHCKHEWICKWRWEGGKGICMFVHLDGGIPLQKYFQKQNSFLQLSKNQSPVMKALWFITKPVITTKNQNAQLLKAALNLHVASFSAEPKFFYLATTCKE